MVQKIKDIIRSAGRGLLRWIPEVLLVFFVLSFLPLLYYLGRVGVNFVTMLFRRPDILWSIIKSSMWTSVTWTISLVGAGIVLWLLFRSWNHLWAVARKMILEAMNRKVVVGLLLFFVVMMPSLRFILETEGSLKSQIQIVLTYSLTLAQILLSLIAVFLCTASLCAEIEQKHVFLVDSKPLHRWKLLAGKLFGVVVMTTALLFLMGGTVYGLVNQMARPRSFAFSSEWEAEEREKMLREVREEVLVARVSRGPVVPDLSSQVDEELQRLEESGDSEQSGTNRKEIRRRLLNRRFTAQSGQPLRFTIPGMRPGSESPLYLRFKPVNTNPEGPETVQGTWVFYAVEAKEDGGAGDGEDRAMSPAYRESGRWVTGGYQEIKVPPEVVTPRGTVHTVFWNAQEDTGIQFDPESGVELLQIAGRFFPNYYRSLLVVLCHIIVLAAIALMMASAFSFPVASFTVGAILIAGLMGPWLMSTTLSHPSVPSDASVGQALLVYLQGAVYFLLRAIFLVLPQFGRFSPLDDLANGRLVSWGFVGQAVSVMCVLKGGIAMLLGAYFYWRRELARIIA